ncbi:MAG: ABC transporter permease [Polyangiaceae bacterium]
MRNTLLLAGRELSAYLRSPLGYVVIAAALLIDGILFYAFALGSSAGARLSADVLQNFFYYASGTTMIAAIALSMRLIAGEREAGTLVLLNTAPIKDGEIVAGKFLSALCFVAALTALTAYMPLLIFVNGRVSVGHILVGYVGLLLLGAAALAIGLFASTLAKSQVIAVILGAAILGTLVLLWTAARATDPPLNTFISGLALHHDRQKPFMTGVLKLENVVFYLAITWFFLLAATKTLEARRWR